MDAQRDVPFPLVCRDSRFSGARGAAPCTERSDANGPDFRKSGPGLAERNSYMVARPCIEVRS